jgi:N-acetyl-gamma-glutamyl-phosphate reductase
MHSLAQTETPAAGVDAAARARVAVAGATGYTGQELLRLLSRHPLVALGAAMSSGQTGASSRRLPGLTRLWDGVITPLSADTLATDADVVFLALPDSAAAELAPALVAAGVRVIDLSGAFRLQQADVRARWYPETHRLPSAVAYGLTERERGAVARAQLVANPGCYPTATLLALAPLYASGCVEPATVIVDAKSGVSGAGGRVGMREEFSFPAVNENLRAYSVTGHRHVAETEQELAALAGAAPETVRISFTPHLLPITRGLYATAYASLGRPVDRETLTSEFVRFYRNAPFVRVTGAAIPEVRHVIGSNACRIGLAIDERVGRVIVLSVIDNLVKGAAGQAIQNMNLMLGLPETDGLEGTALFP